MKYWAVKTFAELMMLVGFLLFLPGLIAAVLMVSNGFNLTGPPAQWFGFVLAVGALIVGLPFVAVGQLLLCVVRIEQNTNDTAHNTKIIAERN